jgi:structure-specific endonuclease subunit SLX1
MIASHPYNTWPLRANFFTEEAHQLWNTAAKPLNLPPGFSFSVELEGVDGCSGQTGSGRHGPIDVTDSKFVSLYTKF